MIIYDKLWELLKSNSISMFQFRYWANIGGGTYQRLRKNEPVSTTTLNNICSALDCQINDIVEYIRDEDDENLNISPIILKK
jgi:DNA-binding Xre family transcriptional regulator